MDLSELERMQDDIAGMLLPDTCNILAAVTTPDGHGGQVITWSTSAAGVRCRKDYRHGLKAQSGAGLVPYTGWIFSLPAGTPLAADNRIEHGGKVYHITGQDSGKSWEAVLRVTAEEI